VAVPACLIVLAVFVRCDVCLGASTSVSSRAYVDALAFATSLMLVQCLFNAFQCRACVMYVCAVG
jgi:hypothetical protein